jgi:hypothetical protein
MQRNPLNHAQLLSTVKAAECRPIFHRRRRMPWWLYSALHALVFLLVVILFFVAMFIIAAYAVR